MEYHFGKEVPEINAMNECQESLLALAETKGFLTFDDIMDASDTFNLSVTEVDCVSENIQMYGILVYEHNPQQNTDQDTDDYSRIDYEAVYREVIEIDYSMRHIVNDIRNCPTPQYGEINKLIRQAHEGNSYAKERLVLIYLRTALKIALARSKQYDLELADAFSAGVMGLSIAIDKYDPDGFSAFHSYASLWIQQNIQRFCNPKWMLFYYPAHARDAAIELYENQDENSESAVCYDEAQIFEEDEIVEEDSRITVATSSRDFKNRVCFQTSHRISWEDVIEDEYDNPDEGTLVTNQYCPGEELEEKVFIYEIHQLLQELTEKERFIICMRFGIGYNKDYTLEEVGQRMGVTRERIRQIESKALRKLRNTKRICQLLPFLS